MMAQGKAGPKTLACTTAVTGPEKAGTEREIAVSHACKAV